MKDVRIVQCRTCKVRRRAPEITDNYEEQYHEPYLEQGQAIHPHQLSHFSDLMMARLRQFFQKDVRFLDVGCSTGRILQLARTMGFDAVGLDYSQWAADHCAKLGFETRYGSLIGQWSEAEQFDVIHCSHTIEHVPDPLAYLAEMHRLVKRGGHIMIACPNYASVPRFVMRDGWPTWCLDSHLWQFTKRQMEQLLKKVGLAVISSRTLHGYSPDSRLKKVALDWSSMLGFGDAVNIVAQKP
ncbi:class I SAM-dependent methyltransferase [Verrucomicrobiota bacterium sgz303538]